MSNVFDLCVPVRETSHHTLPNDSIFIDPFPNVDGSIDETLNEIMEMKIKHADKNRLFQLLNHLVRNVGEASTQLLNETSSMTPKQAIMTSNHLICSKISMLASRFKRKKWFQKNPHYVEPQQKAVGTRIEMIWDEDSRNEVPRLIQSSLQYIPITETLKSFFHSKQNRDTYFQYQTGHSCDRNSIQCFRCGQLYAESEFFQRNPSAIQLQISTDDFEICNPLSSKSNIHKVCAVYLTIRNMPSEYLSRLQNIFLVCLCNANDLKTKTTDFNNILELIVNDVKQLEDVGVLVEGFGYLRGTIVYLTADNLGHNLALAMAGNSSSHFCRICELPRETCRTAVTEDVTKYRNLENYQKCLDSIENAEGKLDLRETCGIVRYCKLNDLSHFNIFKNFSVDIMHDLNEGVVPLILKHLFQFCFDQKIIKLQKLKDMISFYSYPKLFRKSKPSMLNMASHSLGQTAAQLKCLLLNLPLVLHEYRDCNQLKEAWKCVELLIRIFQIVHSSKMSNNLISELQILIHDFLTQVISCFKINLTPKLHYMTHYPTIIRIMGPICFMSMIRYESKHKQLKKIANDSNNFININKTIATTHQELLCLKGNNFEEFLSCTSDKKICKEFLKNNVNNHFKLKYYKNIFEVNNAQFSCFRYERGTVIKHKLFFYEIKFILHADSEFIFLVDKLEFIGIDCFSQSLRMERYQYDKLDLINFNEIVHKNSYSMKSIEDKHFVIIDNIDVFELI